MFEIVVFILVLAVLVLAHELGHFLAAKQSGAKVEEFGFGFPPRIFGIKKGETLYSLNLFPLGGFVKIFGEDNAQKSDPKSFASKSVSRRAWMLSAGVTFNLILAYIIFSAVIWLGMPVDAQDPLWHEKISGSNITVSGVLQGSGAEEYGLLPGDIITGLSDKNTTLHPEKIKDVQGFIQKNKGNEITVLAGKEGDVREINIPVPGEDEENEGMIGIAMSNIGILERAWYFALWDGFLMTVSTLAQIIRGIVFLLGLIFGGHSVAGFVSGPVGIFTIVGSTIDLGYTYLFSLVGILSVNLALINLIPFPALDGGRLLFLVIEAIRGRPISEKITRTAHMAGFAFLLALIVLITYYDVVFNF